MKPYHVAEWVDTHPTWGDNYKGGAIVAVKRVYNWGEELGYIDANPVKKLKKPPAKRREIYMTPEDFEAILAMHSKTDPFHDLLVFLWMTGCRPQEARAIEPRHVDLGRECIVFPKEESKGKRYARTIYLQGPSLEIIQRLMMKRKEGKLFRNTRGEEWSKYALCNRFVRISEKLGKRLFAYSLRHGWATRKLLQGHDHLTLAALLGHRDGSMLAKIYSHVDRNDAHLKKALQD